MAYRKLSNRRSYHIIGNTVMANPITYGEIGAYNREMLAGLVTWEKDVLIDIDDAVLAIVNQPKKSGQDGSDKPRSIPISDLKTLRKVYA